MAGPFRIFPRSALDTGRAARPAGSFIMGAGHSALCGVQRGRSSRETRRRTPRHGEIVKVSVCSDKAVRRHEKTPLLRQEKNNVKIVRHERTAPLRVPGTERRH